MYLLELFEKEKQNKKFEVFCQIKNRIDKVDKGELLASIEYNARLLSSERQELFLQKKDPSDKYHWIDSFSSEMSALKGTPYNFEERIELIKKKVLKDYEAHEYFPKIEFFLRQSNEEIVKKLAHYAAYSEIQDLFSGKDRTVLRKMLRKSIPNGSISLNYADDSEFQYRKLFRNENAYLAAEKTIKKYLLDENGIWIGYDGKKQEIPALIDFLKAYGYIDFTSHTGAVRVFCKRYNIEMSDRTTREKKGFSFDDATKHYRKIFPKI
jgi:hypothetical protein